MNYFDLHCDTPYECYFKKQQFKTNNLAISYEKGKSFENWCQTFAVFINDCSENPFTLYKNILNDFKEKLNCCNNFTPLFSVEGGAVIENKIERLEILKNDGIKFLTLTWNGENLIAGGSKTDKELTDFGKNVIKEMNRLKIGCDLSHLNDKSFYSSIELADFPLATHSNSRKICNVKRNLNDEQLKLIKQKNGIVGLCFYPLFLGENPYENIYQNIYHLCELGLEKNIAIGSDFDGADMTGFIKDISEVPLIYSFLTKKGLDKNLLNDIFYENAKKFVSNL